jgi:uncharacterized membrane protein YfcA
LDCAFEERLARYPVAHPPKLKQDGARERSQKMWYAEVILMGLGVGVLVGLMGIGGGVVLVPAMVYLLGFDQLMAQGTSLFLQLPPLGLGALIVYWREKRVDLWAGADCALGFLIGGYFGSKIAINMDQINLRGAFGIFTVTAAALLWWKSRPKPADSIPAPDPLPGAATPPGTRSPARLILILLVATCVGVFSGLFGVGGGVLLVPLMVLLFAFDQHVAQGTSLIALVPPVGLLAFLNYARAQHVNWTVGLLIMPGVFLGGFVGSRLAQKLSPRRMRRVFAAFLVVLGIWQIASAWLLH